MATLYKYLTGGREVTFLDPDDAYQPEDIRQHWAATFPELGNAATDIDDKAQAVTVDGSEVEVTRVVTFSKKVGTKGCVGLETWQVSGEVRLQWPRRHLIHTVSEFATASTADDAISRALFGVAQMHAGATAAWVSKPAAKVVPPDQMMRAAGAPTLPGRGVE
jgi:PRTRC genetic system protein C